MTIRCMQLGDYDAVMALLREMSGISLRSADSKEATQRYLQRNAGLSFVAEEEGRLIGCIMAGHDGRRGYLQHLAVAPAFRLRGIGSALARHAIDALKTEGIEKSHLDVFTDNSAAIAFWKRLGWELRSDIYRFSYTACADANA